MKRIDRRRFIASSSIGLGALTFGLARGQGVDFSGEIVELIIPFKEGGGSDTWGRFNAPYLSRYLPGQPTVVVRNVPGGNSIAGANRFAARARPDGLQVLGGHGFIREHPVEMWYRAARTLSVLEGVAAV